MSRSFWYEVYFDYLLALIETYISVWFEPTTYSVTEGTDEYVEIVIQSKTVKEVFAVNVSFVADSAEGSYVSS